MAEAPQRRQASSAGPGQNARQDPRPDRARQASWPVYKARQSRSALDRRPIIDDSTASRRRGSALRAERQISVLASDSQIGSPEPASSRSTDLSEFSITIVLRRSTWPGQRRYGRLKCGSGDPNQPRLQLAVLGAGPSSCRRWGCCRRQPRSAGGVSGSACSTANPLSRLRLQASDGSQTANA
jgi:hypothetical protein